MKKVFKRGLAVFLSLIMLFSMMSVGVYATAYELVEINHIAYVWYDNRDLGVYYNDIDSAWNAALEDGNILLLDNWETDEVLTVTSLADVKVFMNGFSIDRGLTSAVDSGEVFLVHAEASLELYGTDKEGPITEKTKSKITGGYNKNGGGGIHIQKESRVYMYGVSVTGNATSERSGGGGVRLQGESSYLYMDEFSSVTGNKAPNGDGGGVSIRGKNSKLDGGSVSNNVAGESGGGISTHAEGCVISGVKITKNTVGEGKKGGGIYMAQGYGCSVLGCTIEENTVINGNGGGIYVDGNGGSLSYSIITKNTAVLGGGVYIDVGDTLSVSGDITVKDNVSNSSSVDGADNLFLATTSSKSAYISGYPTGGNLCIGWDKSVRSGVSIKITDSKGSYDSRYMTADVSGYYIYWSWLTEDGKNDRYLRAANTDYRNQITHSDTDVSVNDRYTVHKNGYLNKFDLQEGVFSYTAMTGGDLDAVYYYSDAYFLDKPDYYNNQLATMSLAAVMSAFNSNATEFDKSIPNDGYANRFRNVKQLLSDIGFTNENIYISESFTLKPTDTSIGVAMGAKQLSYGKDENADKYILIPVIVRGSGYESEWASNVTLGESGEAAGFSGAADIVMAELEKYLSSSLTLDLKKALEEGRVKFWVNGFSRAAATANLVAKRLTDTYGSTNSVYAYCFETPKGGIDAEVVNEEYTYNGQYLNIHNIINSGDIVPFVGPQEMGFKRYGIDHFMPGTEPGAVSESVYTTQTGLTVTTYSDNIASVVGNLEYNERREQMLYQLALIDDKIIFDDYFSLATMNYVGNAVSDKDMVGPLENGTNTTAAVWIPVFVKHLEEWALNGTYSWSSLDGDGFGSDYRKFYSTNTNFCGEEYVTIEQALQVFTKLLFGIENTDEFMNAMMYRMNDFASDEWAVRDFYIGVISMWDEQAQYRQVLYIDDLWEALTKDLIYPDGVPVPAITDFIEYGNQSELKKATYALLAFLFLFVCRDYDSKPSLDGVDTKQIHLGTLLYNISGILQCHYPEVCMAWLRTYDYHYTNTDFAKFNDTSVNLVAGDSAVPEKVTATVSVEGDTSTVSLSAPFGSVGGVDDNSVENGAAIYYQIYKNGTAISEWELYQDAIVLQLEQDAEYSIKTYSVRFQTMSDTVTITDGQIRGELSAVGTMLGTGSWFAIVCLIVVLVAVAVTVKICTKRKKEE